jgi:glucose/mannose transport system substrate-binding protein
MGRLRSCQGSAARAVALAARSWCWLALLIPAGLSACSGEKVLGDYPPSTCDLAEPPENVSRVPLTMATFWAQDDDEKRALDVLVDRAEERGYRVSAWLPDTRVKAQLQIKDSFDDKDNKQLPDVIQVNAGSDVLRWVSQRTAEATDLCALDRFRDHDGWSSNYFESALKPLTCRGQLFGLPVGIHRLNLLFYNQPLYQQLQQLAQQQGLELRDPSELGGVPELLEQLELINKLGAKLPNRAPPVPLALGTSDVWPLTILAFENVLLSLSRDAYRTLWLDKLADDDGAGTQRLERELRHMLEMLRALVEHSNVASRVTWQAAMTQVGLGEAVMTVTGDWGWAQLTDAEPENVLTVPFPGTADSFVYTPDSFAVPRELHKDGFPARSFLRDVVADKTAMIEFSNLKHSVPPRRDLDPDEIARLGTESMRHTYARYADCDGSVHDCELLLAVSGLAPPPGAQPCTDDVDALLTYAVTGREPTREERKERLCTEDFPETSADAEERLIELLLSVAKERFAADCR